MIVNEYTFDDPSCSMYIDNTTSATYTYIYKTLNSLPTTTGAIWLCKRVTNASGVASFAGGVNNFIRPEKLITVAQGLTATYPL